MIEKLLNKLGYVKKPPPDTLGFILKDMLKKSIENNGAIIETEEGFFIIEIKATKRRGLCDQENHGLTN